MTQMRGTQRRLSRQQPKRQPPYYLFTGLVIGLIIGGFFSLIVFPVKYENITPDKMSEQGKDTYRIMVALAFQADGDVGRAQARLAQLRDADMILEITELSRILLSEGGQSEASNALASLAKALSMMPSAPAVQEDAGEAPEEKQPQPDSEAEETGILLTPTAVLNAADAVRTPTPGAESSVAMPAVTFTPRVTSIPDAVLGSAFKVQSSKQLCDLPLQTAYLEVEILDREGQPLAGVPVKVAWEGGEETFFTGLFPYKSPGFADYAMSAGVIYTLRVGNNGEIIRDLKIQDCEGEDGGSFPGGLLLTFIEP